MNVHANIGLIEMVSNHLRAAMGDDFDAETFWGTLDGETDVEDVIGHLLRKLNHATTYAEALKAEATDIKAREARYLAQGRAVKAALGDILDATGERKVEHYLATVSRTKPRVSVEYTDEDAIPSQLCTFVKKPDGAAIKKQLEAGETVPGATLKTGAPGLMVRTK